MNKAAVESEIDVPKAAPLLERGTHRITIMARHWSRSGVKGEKGPKKPGHKMFPMVENIYQNHIT